MAFFGGYFQRFVVVFVFWKSESVIQKETKKFHCILNNKILQGFWSSWQPCPGVFFAHHFERRRGPGDDESYVDQLLIIRNKSSTAVKRPRRFRFI